MSSIALCCIKKIAPTPLLPLQIAAGETWLLLVDVPGMQWRQEQNRRVYVDLIFL
jgi:hypothetical protein